MRTRTLILPLLAALALTACGGSDSSGLDPFTGGPAADETAAGGGAAGSCLAGATDCTDGSTGGGAPPPSDLCAEDDPDCEDSTMVDPDPMPEDPDDFDAEQAREEARALLGMREEELPTDQNIRVGRRGDEQYMLTEDYVLGRKTIALEQDDAGEWRVVEVDVELPDGPETFAA